MKNKMRQLAFALLLVVSQMLFSQQRMDVATLFSGYLKNDLETQRLIAELEKQKLSEKITSINNGFDISLSTGTITLKTGSKTNVEFKPNASVSVPKLSNLKASVSTDIKAGNDNNSVSDTRINLGIDIISNVRENTNIAELRAGRVVLEATRAVQNRALNAERDFYKSLQSLYTTGYLLVSAEKELYDHELKLEQLQAQGYSSSSSQYRTAQMDVLSDKHTVRVVGRELESETAVFASRCGIEYTGTNALEFLPDDITYVEPIDVLSFDKSQYTQIENAEWSHRINSLVRKADKNFSLGVNGGYTFNNANTKSDTADVGATATFQGLSVSAGMNIPTFPVSDTFSPSYTFSLSVSPNTFRVRSLTQQQYTFTEEQELIAIRQAEINYNTAVMAQQRAKEDIEWNKETIKETYDLYSSVAADTEKWFKSGIVSESEYRTSQINKERYRIQMIENAIESIIYNDETKLLFCRDKE